VIWIIKRQLRYIPRKIRVANLAFIRLRLMHAIYFCSLLTLFLAFYRIRKTVIAVKWLLFVDRLKILIILGTIMGKRMLFLLLFH